MADTKLSKSRLEALIAMASGMVAQPASGLAGLYGLATGDYNKAADNVAATQQALTYAPRDPRGLQEIAQAAAPVTRRLDALKHFLGDKTLGHTKSPGLATAAYMVPDTLLTLLGARGMGVKGPKLAELVQNTRELPSMGSARSQIGAINAWHGSPHDFDRFSMNNIGTGEGNQAYGHGLYFAGDKAVAKGYASAVKDMGAVQTANQRMRELAREMDKYEIPGRFGHYNDPRGYELKAEYDALMDGRHETLQKPGNVYNVELAPDEADLLDWDAPLHEQPVNVQQAIAHTINSGKLDADALREIQASHPDALTGKKLYTILQQSDHVSNAAGASEHLRQLGVPGIRYLDGGSRAAGDGSRNYVMFDDSLVNIRGKE